MKKFVLAGAVAGAMIIAASNASAAMGVFTISGTAQNQSYNTQDVPVIQKHNVTQKDLLFFLEQGTGDSSITNKSTKIWFDPDTNNALATAWAAVNDGGGSTIYGIFYYSNSVSGLVRLDGTNISGYYSYMEFDYFNSFDGELGNTEGFWNPYAMEYNSVAAANASENSWTQTGNAIFYVHSDPYYFNILGQAGIGEPSAFYFANNWDDFYQPYAAVMHGTITYKIGFSGTNTVTESFTLKGSGDLDYDYNPGVFNGTATFTGKGPSEFGP